MINPANIKDKATSHFYNWLRAIAEGIASFQPLVIQRIGDNKDATERWDDLTEIYEQSKSKIGYGYRVELEPPRPNSTQKQSKIKAIMFDTESDLVRFVDLESDFSKFKTALTLIHQEVPNLKDWCAGHVKKVIQYSDIWPQLLAVVRFFQENPQPGLPLRLLVIGGVDTKFMEQNNKILCTLLDLVLPPECINNKFRLIAKRYGLPEQEPLVECAWNDLELTHYFHGFSRLAFPSDQLAAQPLPISKVIVVENKTSMQQLLQHGLSHTLIVFGGGFGVSLLQGCTWMKDLELYYWGDLDAHGLAILSQVRGYFPHVQALMMDQATWDAHQHTVVAGKHFKGNTPSYLTAEEQDMFQLVSSEMLRLEQEQLDHAWVQVVLDRIENG